MVNITIYIEGGISELANANVGAKTMDNSQRLRESFHKLFSQSFESDQFNLIIEVGGPVSHAIKLFKSEVHKGENVHLLIDLDRPKNEKNIRLENLEIEEDTVINRVFFMVQEMEAWILSQPNKIEKCFAHLKRRKIGQNIKDDGIILGRNVEDIVKPSEKLHTLLGRYFRIEKKGKQKNKKYNKLVDGADLLELLDFRELRQTFDDLENFAQKLKKKS